MKTTQIPQVDMTLVAESSWKRRRSILGFVPKIDLVVVDYGQDLAIDAFYINCQNQRDFYRDPYKKIRQGPAFAVQGPCGKRSDPNTRLLMLPYKCTREPQPIIYPLARPSVECMEPIHLGGTYTRPSCNKYRR